jgi:hypothetical protein
MVTFVGCTPPENFSNLKPGNSISCILIIHNIINNNLSSVVEKRNNSNRFCKDKG